MKIFPLIFLLTTNVLYGLAQTLIPKAGLTLASNLQNSFSIGLPGSTTQRDIHPIAGFTIGAALKIQVTPQDKSGFSFQPEINLIQKGYKTQSTVTVNSGSDTYITTNKENFEIYYIELPLLVIWEFAPNVGHLHLNFGPSFAHSIGGRTSLESMSNINGVITLDKSAGEVKFGQEPQDNGNNAYFDHRSDMGLQFGAGMVLAKRMMIDVRYGMGLTNLYSGRPSQNKVIQLTLGIPIHLK